VAPNVAPKAAATVAPKVVAPTTTAPKTALTKEGTLASSKPTSTVKSEVGAASEARKAQIKMNSAKGKEFEAYISKRF
jgi:hypothetical protein